MNIYFNFLAEKETPIAMYFLSDNGSFYAESTDAGLIGKDLLYNEYMFHFEGSEDRMVIILKESENRISEALKVWLENYTNPSFVTNNKDNFKLLTNLVNMDFTNYNTTIIGLDNEDLPVIDKTNKLKEKYNAKG
jgi:hypothetical protein